MALKRVLLRRDTAVNWTINNPTLLQWELWIEFDTKKLKIWNWINTWTTLGYLQADLDINDPNLIEKIEDLIWTKIIAWTNTSIVYDDTTWNTTINAIWDMAKVDNLSWLANYTTARTNLWLWNVDNTTDLNKPISTATQTALDTKVDENSAITWATKTKITYDSKWLITAWTDLVEADIPALAISKITDLQTNLDWKVIKVSSTDNAITRFDWTNWEIQDSGITIDDNGRISIPLQPIMSGQMGTAMENPNSAQVLLFNEFWVNQWGITYNAWKFTVPVNWVYRITLNPFFRTWVSNWRVYIRKNTTWNPWWSSHIGHTYRESATYDIWCLNSIVNLSANDYITFYLRVWWLYNISNDRFNQFTIEKIA